ncbi:DUF262 domain-containing protein [Nocardia sp. NBC_00565]|uniref:DUF262 domain-containing protein n=1 Tax=Nocardia sp. NBC_00565 TaxID=2975993 RepID=UPI002E8183A9|nr:DUF262 domain-containing protein [Nocardia sp. NBC_00565]WUC04293.1 DUF262 domain-containing protein [Nocardia sp. NBC_00565]
MTMSLGTTPTAHVFEVEAIVTMVRDGKIRIPEFQRPFRWGIEDARRLFDSIIRGYPLGSLLLWARPADAAHITLGALRIDAPQMDNALWVVDGQQRVTTLANALSAASVGDERFALSFDPVTGQIVPTAGARPFTIPLPLLFDLPQLMAWFRDFPDAMQYFDAATVAATKIRQFKIPASVVETQDESVLRDIFDRLNSYGKRLTRAEVFTALHPVPTGTGRSASTAIEDIIGHISADLDFGVVDGNTIFKAVLARRGPDVTREMRTEFADRRSGEFPGEDAETAYREAQSALDRAVEFLQLHADTPHFAFLPYRHLLVVLTRVFGHHPELDDRQTQLLRRWYWRAAAAGTTLFPGGVAGTTRTLCALVVPGDLDATLTGLLDAVPSEKINWPSAYHFRTNHASGKIIACVLWSKNPRSLRDARRLDLNDLVDALGEAQTPRPALTAVVPRSVVATASKSDWAARWLLVPGLEAAPSEVPAILAERPLGVTETEWNRALESHVIDPDIATWLAEGKAWEFTRHRVEALRDRVDSFMHQRLEYGYEDTPPLDHLVLDDLESELGSQPDDSGADPDDQDSDAWLDDPKEIDEPDWGLDE